MDVPPLPGREASLKLDLLSVAVRSPKFWCYAEMINLQQQFLSHVCKWAEGCHCHSFLAVEQGNDGIKLGYSASAQLLFASRAASRLSDPAHRPCDGKRYGPCPMAGRRAPELALGGVTQAFRDFTEESLIQVMQHSIGVDAEDLAVVMQDFPAWPGPHAAGSQDNIAFLGNPSLADGRCWPLG